MYLTTEEGEVKVDVMVIEFEHYTENGSESEIHWSADYVIIGRMCYIISK